MKKQQLNLPKLALRKVTITPLQLQDQDKIAGGSATCPISTNAVSVCTGGCPSLETDCGETIANKQSHCCAHLSMANPPVSMCNPCIPEHTQPLLCA